MGDAIFANDYAAVMSEVGVREAVSRAHRIPHRETERAQPLFINIYFKIFPPNFASNHVFARCKGRKVCVSPCRCEYSLFTAHDLYLQELAAHWTKMYMQRCAHTYHHHINALMIHFMSLSLSVSIVVFTSRMLTD